MRDRLAQRRAGDQQGLRGSVAGGLDDDAVGAGGVVEDRHLLTRHFGGADAHGAAVDVDERVVRRWQRLRESRAGREMQVEVKRFGARALHRPGVPVACAGNDPNADPVDLERRNLPGSEVAVPGRNHLVGGGQVQPELETLHHAFFLLGHLAVDHAAAGGHPLHAAVGQQPFVAGRVAMAHAAGDHVGDGLEAAVRMIGKAGDVVAGLVGTKRVEHQERIEPML